MPEYKLSKEVKVLLKKVKGIDENYIKKIESKLPTYGITQLASIQAKIAEFELTYDTLKEKDPHNAASYEVISNKLNELFNKVSTKFVEVGDILSGTDDEWTPELQKEFEKLEAEVKADDKYGKKKKSKEDERWEALVREVEEEEK